MIRSRELCEDQGQDIAGEGQVEKMGPGSRGGVLKNSATKTKVFCLPPFD